MSLNSTSTDPQPAPLTLAAFAKEFEVVLARELANIQSQLEKSGQALIQERDQVFNGLSKSRERLSELFADPDLTNDRDRVMQEIDGQLTWINRKLRPGIDREIRSLAPRRRPLVTQLIRLRDRIQEITDRLPDAPMLADEAAAETPFLRHLRNRLAQISLSPHRLAEELLPDNPGRHPLVQKHEALHAQTLSDLADLWRGIRFHFEIVLDELRKTIEAEAEEEKTASKVEAPVQAELAAQVLDALENGQSLLGKTLDPLLAFYASLPGSIEKIYREWLTTFEQELARIGHLDQTFRHLAIRLRRPTARVKERATELLDLGREEVSRTASSGLHQTGGLLRNLQDLIGRTGNGRDALLPYTDLPSSEAIREQAEELPALYRRIFTLGPLRNREFLVAREDEMETLDALVLRWREKKACSAAIIGPEGSGKTSLINCFASEYGAEEEILRIDLKTRFKNGPDLIRMLCEEFELEPGIADVDALTKHLLAGPRRIIILEGGHQLAARTMGGFETMKTFFSLLSATRKHLLWIVTFRKYPWARFDYLLNIGSHFTHDIRTLFHDEAELRETLMLRHRTSGLTLEFSAPDDEKSPEEESVHRDRFFREMFTATSGNIDAAIYHWLRSIRYDAETRTLKVAPLSRPDHRVLRALGREHLFALGEILSHGGLTVAEFSEIFSRDLLESRLQLDTLTQLSLLRPDSESATAADQRYQINPVFFGPLSATLESMNILY